MAGSHLSEGVNKTSHGSEGHREGGGLGQAANLAGGLLGGGANKQSHAGGGEGLMGMASGVLTGPGYNQQSGIAQQYGHQGSSTHQGTPQYGGQNPTYQGNSQQNFGQYGAPSPHGALGAYVPPSRQHYGQQAPQFGQQQFEQQQFEQQQFGQQQFGQQQYGAPPARPPPKIQQEFGGIPPGGYGPH